MIETNRNKKISMFRGNTLAFAIKFRGLQSDLSAAYFTCRNKLKGDTLFQCSIGDGIEKVVGAEELTYRFRVAPEKTEDLDAPATYVYDVTIDVNGDRFTLITGPLSLIERVT